MTVRDTPAILSLVQLSSAPLAELSASLEILYQIPIPISMSVPMTMPAIDLDKMLAQRVPEYCHHVSMPD
jgi:hypothetical protein